MKWNHLSIPKCQRCTRWSLGMVKLFHPTLHWACDHLSMQGLSLSMLVKSGPSRATNSKKGNVWSNQHHVRQMRKAYVRAMTSSWICGSCPPLPDTHSAPCHGFSLLTSGSAAFVWSYDAIGYRYLCHFNKTGPYPYAIIICELIRVD